MQWTVHGEKPLYQDQWLDVRIADVEIPGGRRLEHRLIRCAPGAGCVVMRDDHVLLLWRHRFITDTWGYEIPIGAINPGESPMDAAARETEEETGWRPGLMEFLLRVEPSAGISDSVHHVYRADGAERMGPPEDGFESDHIAWVPLSEIPNLVADGEISSGTSLAALLYVLAAKNP
jgi:8-oxo-dGTP pyrophosphatase MutT (NUDIX family)